MTKEQKISLRDAIDADLRHEPVQFESNGGNWDDSPDPSFSSAYRWRPKPKEPLKVWMVGGEYFWSDHVGAKKRAIESGHPLIELTETARKSFSKREPLRFWGRVIESHTLPTAIDTSRARIADLVELTGGRVAEFVEVVK